MSRIVKKLSILLFAVGVIILIQNATKHQKVNDEISFPSDYEQFNQIKVAENNDKNLLKNTIPDGFYKVAMDSIAFSYYQKIKNDSIVSKSQHYPDGSRIVLVQYSDKDLKIPNLLLIMEKDDALIKSKKWAWQGFKLPEKKAFVNNWVVQCANCHYNSAKNQDFTFMLD